MSHAWRIGLWLSISVSASQLGLAGAFAQEEPIDSDGDGTPDALDGCPNQGDKTESGVCGCDVPDNDSDGDGALDCIDECPGDSQKSSAGVCGCNAFDGDSDLDGTPDCNDGCPDDSQKTSPETCGCNISDADLDGDYLPDCNDGCPTDPLKPEPGVCGCNVLDEDRDSDGAADCVDACPEDPAKTEAGLCGCGISEDDEACLHPPQDIESFARPFTGAEGDCTDGGIAVEYGIDEDDSGTLTGSELLGVEYICTDASTDPVADPGSDPSPPALLVVRTELMKGENSCPNGGEELAVGLDRNGDAELQASEATEHHTLCREQVALPTEGPIVHGESEDAPKTRPAATSGCSLTPAPDSSFSWSPVLLLLAFSWRRQRGTRKR